MHIEKNVCESILGTLLDDPNKTKDGKKARLDLQEMNIRSNLHLEQRGKHTFLPPAKYTLSRKEKRKLCEWFASIKVPNGYSSNFKRLVSLKDLRLIGMKSHDCHVVMQQFLPLALRGICSNEIRFAISKLCYFFNSICKKVIDPSSLDDLQAELVKTVCSFFPHFVRISQTLKRSPAKSLRAFNHSLSSPSPRSVLAVAVAVAVLAVAVLAVTKIRSGRSSRPRRRHQDPSLSSLSLRPR